LIKKIVPTSGLGSGYVEINHLIKCTQGVIIFTAQFYCPNLKIPPKRDKTALARSRHTRLRKTCTAWTRTRTLTRP